jgi:hypothetical protein
MPMTTFPEIWLKKSNKKYDKYELVEDCAVNLPFGKSVVIPKGYSTDFATVPQAFWSFCPPHGLAAMPSVVHDYMYDNRLFEDSMGERMARRYADLCFLVLMEKANVPKWQRVLYYYVVRTFAGPWWRR